MNKLKLGEITWYDPTAGAFIEERSNPSALESTAQSKAYFSSGAQVFAPTELIKSMILREGQLVQFEEVDKIATRIEPLTPGRKAYKAY